MRLCANTGCRLHLIHPIGFDLDEKKLKRAGMDYRDMATVIEHENFADFMKFAQNRTLFALTTKAKQNYSNASFKENDILLFGPETRGLPDSLLESLADTHKLRLPMFKNSRSLNLSNTVAIVVYESLRQNDFSGLS